MKKLAAAELVFIPAPGVGHLISTVEMAKLLITRDQRLSITVLIITFPSDTNVTAYASSLHQETDSRLCFIDLPLLDSTSIQNSLCPIASLSAFIDSHAPHVRDAVARIATNPASRLAGFVLDVLCTSMIDVANEFGVPAYVFFTSGAAFLGFNIYLLNISDNRDVTEFVDSVTELSVPSFVNLVPTKVVPLLATDKEGGSAMILSLTRRLKQVKGIMVNTLSELESHALRSLVNADTPPVYPVGPVLNINGFNNNNDLDNVMIMRWLDRQQPSSVVFLCFGSMGSFGEDQVKEIAYALEQSGHRFLWSLRQSPPQKGKLESPTEYSRPGEVLPEGFLERTASVGMVTGWVPQVEVLSHWAVGGFVSHCGWNSILESLWYGVPVATWPMYAEQQMNAFEMVVELGLGVEIKIDYRRELFGERNTSEVVKAEEIEKGIRRVMECESEERKRVKEMKDKCRMAVMEGGSSYKSLGCFIENILQV